MNRLLEFAIGLLFGIGLIVSGMTDPGKVTGFLDLAGAWDPSLAFVMGGAIAVGVVAFTLARRRTTAILGGAMQLPARRDVDRPLVLGSLVFGVGWGVSDACPGPIATQIGQGIGWGLWTLAGVVIGVYLFLRRSEETEPATDPVPVAG